MSPGKQWTCEVCGMSSAPGFRMCGPCRASARAGNGRQARRSSDPWIGETPDRLRQFLRVYGRDGEPVYVTVHDILDRCTLHKTEESASSAMAREAAEYDEQQRTAVRDARG